MTQEIRGNVVSSLKKPFGAHLSTKLGSVNSKLTCTLSCASDGDCGGGGGGPIIIDLPVATLPDAQP